MDLKEVILLLQYVAACEASQDLDRHLRTDVQTGTRSVVQVVPASSLACVMSIGGVSKMTVFLVCVFPHHLPPAQA